jgi:hypothetical protein
MTHPIDTLAEQSPARRHQSAPRRTPRRRFRRLSRAAALAVLGGVGLAACGSQTATSSHSGASAGARPSSAALTLTDGKSTTLAAFRGRPVLVWFVENGCASCAASIPVVAHHLPAFAHAHTRVLVLGVYGAFGQGTPAARHLAGFGRSAAGPAFTDAGWTWGLASPQLTTAYDPGGVPDEYFLLNGAGRTVYHGSVPVSTMGALLTHLKSVPS